MSTIKQDRKDLEALLNGISPIQPTSSPGQSQLSTQQPVAQTAQAAVVDSTADTNINTLQDVLMFDFSDDSLRKGLRKRARKTILNIVNHILPEDMTKEDYIQDKIEQDIETLTDLYFQAESNKLMQVSIIKQVQRGNATPRMYEVFAQLTDRISGINKQVISTEQTIRKTYVYLKFEIRDKMAEDIAAKEMNQIGTSQGQKQIENNSLIVTSSKDLNNLAKQRHREALEKAKETTYTEE